jgi:hypothetical protein
MTVQDPEDPLDVERSLEVYRAFEPLRYDLPRKLQEKFRVISDRLGTEEPPLAFAHLAPTNGRDWLSTMKERIFGHTHDGLGATNYHLDRVRDLEREVQAVAQANRALIAEGSTVSFPCQPLNYEYQAFAFSLRRTLEYVAGATASFFKTEGSRIRTLSKTIEGKAPEAQRLAVQERLAEADLAKVIGTGDRLAVRDRLAHFESVDAGTINVMKLHDGRFLVMLLGGGEDLPFSAEEEREDLPTVLARRAEWLEDLTFGLFGDLGLIA